MRTRTLSIVKTARKMKTMNTIAALNNPNIHSANNLWHFLFVVATNLQGNESGMTNMYFLK